MDAVGMLTVRFDSGLVWSLPFTEGQVRELVKQLKEPEHQGREELLIAEMARTFRKLRQQPEWFTLVGPDSQGRAHALTARRGAIESMLWAEEPGTATGSPQGVLGDDATG